MPTELPCRRPVLLVRDDAGMRNAVIAATITLSALCLLCELWLGQTLGYSLGLIRSELQLGP